MYQALYRKWRPRIFDDVVGQEHITTTLKNEVAAGRPSHAYLFCGTRGTGKTSCSKILAKAVNCPNQKDGNPCCVCEICKGIDEDSILDVTEIDAASNSGVDNIRDLREEANFTPAVAKYRVYIIDETHMLSTGAFNALLKIMEEPPPHVLFILATTEIHKVPATILSRCQRFDFKRIASEIISARLLYIAKQENVSLDEDAALLIARLSDGGMRDAISLLDLCLTSADSVSVDVVIECAGLVGQSHLFSIARAINDHDGGKSLSLLEGLWEKSIDYQRLCEQLISFYRNLMVAKSVAKPEELIACLPSELLEYKSIANDVSIEFILNILSILQDTLARMSRTSQRRTELEMGLLKLCSTTTESKSNNDSVKPLLARIEKLERLVSEGISTTTQDKPAAKTSTPKPVSSPTLEEIRKTPVEIFDKWQDVLDVLKDKNAALYGTLSKSTAYVGDEIMLVDAGNSMFSSMVKSDGFAKESLRDAVFSVTNKKYRLGSYNPKEYEVKKEKSNPLDEILKRADDSGVDVKIEN